MDFVQYVLVATFFVCAIRDAYQILSKVFPAFISLTTYLTGRQRFCKGVASSALFNSTAFGIFMPRLFDTFNCKLSATRHLVNFEVLS